MIKIFKNSSFLFLFLVSILNASLVSASAANEITVDQPAHALVAPEGCQYQWYYNDQLIQGEINREVAVKESGVYSVEMTDETGSVNRQEALVAVTATGAIVKIFLIGDSTVCNYNASAYPMMGWGQMIAYFFNKANVVIDNRAIGGRSSRSFYEEGRWTTVRDALKTGDFVFIQFGHNDRDTKPERYTSTNNYKKFLTIYVKDSRAKGAIPVLVSPMVMNAWRNGVMRNVFTEAGNDYRGAMKVVADSLKVPFIDLNLKSWNLYKGLGVSYLDRFVYHTYPAGEYPNYPAGNSDGTHFKISGATENARMVVEGLKESTDANIKSALVPYLLPTYAVSASANLKGADSLISRSVSYPPGIEVTVKIVPKAKTTFLNWNDPAGKSVTTDRKYIFTMGNAAVNYTAVFKGGVVTGLEEEFSTDVSSSNCFPNPFVSDFHIAAEGLFFYSIQDVNGVVVEKGQGKDKLITGSNLASGFYMVKIQTDFKNYAVKLLKK